jgi:hypothetical protein
MIFIFLIFNFFLFDLKNFEFSDYFKLENSYKEYPNGDKEYLYLSSIRDLSKDTYIALLKKEKEYKIDSPRLLDEINKQKKENKIIIDIGDNLKIEKEIFLAFLKKNGKIQMEGEIINADIDKGNPKPFFLEDEPLCPYGFINSNDKNIYCFNYSLSLKSKISIPLEKVIDYTIAFDGKKYKIWVFGKGRGKEISKIYDLKEKKWFDFQKNIDDLYEAISKKAKDSEGNQIKLSKNYINFYKFDEENILNNSVDFMAYADEVEPKEQNFFKGKRHFFKVSIDLYGNIYTEKLNFSFNFDNIKEVKWEKESNTLHLPSYYKDYYPPIIAPMGGKSFIVYFFSALSFPDENNNYEKEILEVFNFFVYFVSENSEPKFFDNFSELKDEVFNKTKDFEKLWIHPFCFHIKKNEFLFLANCKNRDEKCYANVLVSPE